MAAKAIAQIKRELSEAGEQLEELLAFYEQDDRKGVLQLVAKYRREIEKLKKEQKRIQEMSYYEKKYSDYQVICGIDEVGRGPLAGPVVAGAVILPKDCNILYLNDSKKLSAAKRETLYEEINEKAVSWALGVVSPERIDEINILNATYEAMQKAIQGLSTEPDLLLVDAVTIPNVAVRQVGIVKGDAKSVSIAAASIMAKVSRDRMMEEMDQLYPEYAFADNKGYGTSVHLDAIRKYGPSPIHRRTFIKNYLPN